MIGKRGTNFLNLHLYFIKIHRVVYSIHEKMKCVGMDNLYIIIIIFHSILLACTRDQNVPVFFHKPVTILCKQRNFPLPNLARLRSNM